MCSYLQNCILIILIILVILDHSLVSVWWYQRLYTTICPPDDEHMCSKHVEAWTKLIITFSASGWVILINKYIEMHGQQNINNNNNNNNNKGLLCLTDTSLYIYIHVYQNEMCTSCLTLATLVPNSVETHSVSFIEKCVLFGVQST